MKELMDMRTRDVKAGSDEVLLTYVGDGRAPRAVPATDLTGNDIARLAYRRELGEVTRDVGQPVDREDPDSKAIARPDPRSPGSDAIRAAIDELLATGLYEEAEQPKTPAAQTDKAAEPANDSTPDQPAEPAAAGDTPEG